MAADPNTIVSLFERPIGRRIEEVIKVDQANEEDAFATDQVTQAAGQEQESAEGDQIGIHNPGQAGLRESEENDRVIGEVFISSPFRRGRFATTHPPATDCFPFQYVVHNSG